MIVEYIRYTIPEEQRMAFVAAYEAARASLDRSPHCLAYELSQGVEEPGNFILRIEWDSIEGHEQGFRRSPEFGPFLATIRPYIPQIAEMRHYRHTSVVANKGSTTEG